VRLGVTEGVKIKCAYKLPGGTVVISKQHQEIAVGSEIAKKIIVKKI
ncbi:FeoA domain-containing protein, partial [Candidatus Kryptonium thompsonii]